MQKSEVAVKPQATWIGRSKKTEPLYSAEKKRDKMIEVCARIWLALRGYNPASESDLWTIGIPQALFDTLESFSDRLAIPAAIAFLELKGFHIGGLGPVEHGESRDA